MSSDTGSKEAPALDAASRPNPRKEGWRTGLVIPHRMVYETVNAERAITQNERPLSSEANIDVSSPSKPGAAASDTSRAMSKVWRLAARSARFLVPAADRRLGWLIGLGVIALSAFGVAANLNLPWLSFPIGSDSSRLSFWTDLRNPKALSYEQRLLLWPLLACGLAASAGIIACARAFVSAGRPGHSAKLLVLAMWIAGWAGFLLALTGTRWLGFQLARELDTGPVKVRLHLMPYLNLGIGLTLLVGAAWGILRQTQRASLSLPLHRLQVAGAGVASLGLLLLPTVPFAKLRLWGGQQIWVDEFTMAVLGTQEDFWSLGAPAALGLARVTLWCTLGAATASGVVVQTEEFLRLPKYFSWLKHAAAANVLLVLAGLGFAMRFYERIPHLREGAAPAFNPFLPLVLVGLALLNSWYTGNLLRAQRFCA